MVTGLELTPQMLAEADAEGGAGRCDLLVLADARRMPFADASVDALFAAGLVNHLPDPAAGLAELARGTPARGVLGLVHPVCPATPAAPPGPANSPDGLRSPGPPRHE